MSRKYYRSYNIERECARRVRQRERVARRDAGIVLLIEVAAPGMIHWIDTTIRIQPIEGT